MKEWSGVILLITTLSLVASSWGQFVVPDVEIIALAPKGIRVSIPDIPGIKQFAFHGKLTKEGTRIDGEGTLNTNRGRWVFQDPNIQLKARDKINYWVYVQYESLGYRKDKQQYTVDRLLTREEANSLNSGGTLTNVPKPKPGTGTGGAVQCATNSITERGGRPACQGRVIFEDKFNREIDTTKWLVEQKLSDDQQENPFVSYQGYAVGIEQTKLKITPRIQANVAGFKDKIKTGILDLRKNCTSRNSEQCYIKAEGANYLPPVVSGRLSTRNSFSFKYGRVDIRAQVPQGDWIYPEMYLVPTEQEYGSDGYESGVIRVAFVRGNVELTSDTENFNNNVLSAGILLDQSCRTQGIVKNPNEAESWGGAYHLYSLIWEPNKLTFLVDDQPYGTITPPEGGFASYLNSPDCNENLGAQRWTSATLMAPFDKEFHIVLGVGVGGVSDFPDDIGSKPWNNFSPKAKSEFWKGASSWIHTWEANKSLYVDNIKVTAL